ncbi:ead/Ea22-like family protein [Enterobacter hormaechei]|uniref:ead/Ea22-like family protein n=1 Tax=Enterobacter hormaechei TaxID=158836 RepID=UPI001F1B1A45|nr:ead/Ea22-like family protein [Enterobacter hormaechei]MCF0046696.1 ead/Ea22-like family protein [Enterobacter hormaechei]
MSNIDKRALREAAEKAGSDKWQAKKINGDFYVIRNGSYEKQHGFTSYQPIAEIEHKPVRDFVAAANPATVLALLDELEAKDSTIATQQQEIRTLLNALEAAGKRIAEMQALASGVKQFSEFQICHYGATEDYAKGYIDCQNNYNKVLFAATGKGE